MRTGFSTGFSTGLSIASAVVIMGVLAASGCEEAAVESGRTVRDTTPAVDPATDPTVSRPPLATGGVSQPSLGKAKGVVSNTLDRAEAERQRKMRELGLDD